MMPEKSASALLLTFLLVLNGCDLLLDRGSVREIGVITQELLEEPHLVVPSSAGVGEVAEVVVTTGAPDGCYSADNVVVSRTGDTMRLVPHHRFIRGTCTMAPVLLRQTVSLRFDAPGEYVIQIVARERMQDAAAEVLAERRLLVR